MHSTDRLDATFAPAENKEEFVFAAGRVWDEAKNLATLEGIAPALAWPICIAGEDCREEASCGENHAAIRLGRLPSHELARWMSRASIYALPARYEPFGLSVLEAALSGCALVLGDIPSLRENWEGCALFVPPDDADALERALTELIGNERLRNELAGSAMGRALAFTPERMASGYLCAYHQLLGSVQHEPIMVE